MNWRNRSYTKSHFVHHKDVRSETVSHLPGKKLGNKSENQLNILYLAIMEEYLYLVKIVSLADL